MNIKKISLYFTIYVFALFTCLDAAAFVRYEDKTPKKRKDIKITGFINYTPLGFVEHPDEDIHGKFSTVFQPMIDTIAKENNFRIFYMLQKKNYDDLVQDVRKGEYDLILGAYYQTELYRGIELIYPAAIVNPITVFMLPNRINEVKSMDDLKKFKGVKSSKEVYTDYVNTQLKQFNIENVDNSYDMFEKLFTKEADYILASHYYGIIESIKLGIREQVAVARQTIWRVPVFVGVSQLSRERQMLSQKLTHYLEKDENRKLIQDNVAKMIADFEKEYYGVVPPTFGLEKSDK